MPQLREVIQEMAAGRPDQMIRIGCRHGSGYIYVGRAAGVDFDQLNETVRQKLPRNAPNQYKAETKQKWREAIADYKPLESRPIEEIFLSEVEDHIIIIIEGFGGFIQYDPEDSGNKEYDQQAMIDLVAALYRENCRELITAYAREDESDIRRCEAWIRENRYGFVADPEGIIRACQQATGTKYIKNIYQRTK